MMWSAQSGHEQPLHTLIHARADVDREDKKGNTALCLAAQHGHDKITKALVQSGAEIDVHNHDGFTPLELAAKGGHAVTMSVLIDENAELLPPKRVDRLKVARVRHTVFTLGTAVNVVKFLRKVVTAPRRRRTRKPPSSIRARSSRLPSAARRT